MNDLALWRKLKEGDSNALEKIYREQVSALLSYGKKLSKNEQLVEDAIQDLFIELWKNRNGLGDTDSIRRYLLTALRRKLIRMIQKQSKQQGELKIDQLPFMATMGIDEKIMAQELSEEQHQQLKLAMDQLSKRQKEVIYLKYYMELDYKAIGEVMNLNYQSVRNLSFNALKSLKDKFLAMLFLLAYFFFDFF
ncbi:MAG: sigma-70 family RNA polymerase sigma factor [Bacteroidota bacterium]